MNKCGNYKAGTDTHSIRCGSSAPVSDCRSCGTFGDGVANAVVDISCGNDAEVTLGFLNGDKMELVSGFHDQEGLSH